MSEHLVKDPTTPQAQSRSRLLVRGLITSLITRGVAGVTPLVLIPLTLAYLGQPIFGLWMTVLSLTSMALWSDLGLGSGLLTQLTRSLSLGERHRAREQVTSAYVTLTGVAIVVLAVLLGAQTAFDWPVLLNAQDPQARNVAHGIAVACLSAFAVNIPVSLVQKIQYASQEATASNVWQAIGSLSSLLAAGLAVATEQSPVVVVAAVAFAAPATALLNSIVYFARNRDLRPDWRSFHATTARDLLRLGAQFFGISLITSLALNVDNLIISHTLGLRAVADYSVAFRTLSALGLVITFASLPFWSSTGDALARGDVVWVHRTTRLMSVGSACIVALVGAGIVLLRGPVFGWLSPGYVPSVPLLAGLVVWWALVAFASPLFSVQNAASVLRPQAMGWACFLLLTVPLKIVAARQLGTASVPAVSVAVYLVVLLPFAVAGYRKAVAVSSLTGAEAA
ncbi:oligosaccharide flippase family protein [Terrabacter sp. LjRoot27]|uniref:lipopolysaccharide biosynthesis protein n=1 Tax=Terrabacter sp. LjRoot27 TaxID=3342306 RepID=UPI003ED0E9F4